MSEIENNMEIRRILWLSHGHTHLYGDDGEMQCHQCGPGASFFAGHGDYRSVPLLLLVKDAMDAMQAALAAKDQEIANLLINISKDEEMIASFHKRIEYLNKALGLVEQLNDPCDLSKSLLPAGFVLVTKE